MRELPCFEKGPVIANLICLQKLSAKVISLIIYTCIHSTYKFRAQLFKTNDVVS